MVKPLDSFRRKRTIWRRWPNRRIHVVRCYCPVSLFRPSRQLRDSAPTRSRSPFSYRKGERESQPVANDRGWNFVPSAHHRVAPHNAYRVGTIGRIARCTIVTSSSAPERNRERKEENKKESNDRARRIDSFARHEHNVRIARGR